MVSCLRLGLVLALALAAATCERVPLLAPTESTISVFADAQTLAPGGRTQVTATVTEQGGTPVQNGTLVRFSATLGRVEPAEVETRGGVATSTFIAGSASGTAQVRASSGAASGSGSSGENGEGATATNVVNISIGGAAAATVVVSANPSRLGPNGGTTTITASVLDLAGNRLSGVPVTFTTDQGSLSSTSALTDGNGDARISLTTNRAAKVTARTGGGDSGSSGEVTVAIAAAGTVSLALTASSVVAGSPVTLTVTAAAETAPRVSVNWGDGTTTDLGTVSAAGPRAVTHTYQSSGTFTIIATATADGETFTASTTVTVTARAPLSVSVTAAPAAPQPQCTPITFTAAVEPAADVALISSVRWTIASNASSENETITTTGRTLTRVFQNPGRKTVSVTVTTQDGREGNGQTQIVVSEPATEPGPRCN